MNERLGNGSRAAVRTALYLCVVAGGLFGGSAASASGAANAGVDVDARHVAREQLHATLWMQTSAEYRALVAQTYRLATERLELALGPGTAALEQADVPAERLAALPPAVVLDLDETVLDNSFYQARLLRERREYSDASWDAWVAEAAAPALPGAREFLEAVRSRGIRIFYVTNRECPRTAPPPGSDPCPAGTATRRNLRALGLPGADDPEALLLRRSRPEWSGRSKAPRRAAIAERYRIIAMVGDDLQDFVDRGVHAVRGEQLDRYFGSRWFLLPNAMYGSWERSLADPACTPGMAAERCSQAVIERKYALLEVEPPPPGEPRRWDPESERLRLATWNLDYLLEPATFAALAPGCTSDGSRAGGAERSIPCSIVPRLARTAEDFAALRRYAERLDGDVVALQEVDGVEAARRVFPGYEFCFSTRTHVQKNGFAIRPGLPFRCESEYLPLSLGDSLRRGVVVTLFPGMREQISLLNVHLKSGCHQGVIDGAQREACAALAAQAEPLERWIDAQAAAGLRFAVLGDFNRRFALERGPARDAAGRLTGLLAEIGDGEPAGARLTDVTRGTRFVGCSAGDSYTAYIDTVLLGERLARRYSRRALIRLPYDEADIAAGRRLSDHCAVGVSLPLR
jgi:5'-nucleotidase (lipoprotein e(P4) family)